MASLEKAVHARFAWLFIAAWLLPSLACGPESQDSLPGSSRESIAATSVEAPADHPNLLLITMDTTRADSLGAYGRSLSPTPNLDRLASKGVLFEQVVTTNPETLPSHSSLFTGRWPFVHGVRANGGYLLSEGNVTLAEHLRDLGFATGAEVAATVLRQETRVIQGFEHYRGAESPGVTLKMVPFLDEHGEPDERNTSTRVGADIARFGIEFLREHRNEPFFLWLHFFDPHSPYRAPPSFNRKFPDDPYLAEVASADFQIGMVLRELEALGVSDRTLIALTSDHGEGLREHGEPSHSFFVYDTVMRVPMILAGLPDLPRGKRVASLVRTIDLAPTVLDLLDVPPLPKTDGRSLVGLMRGDEEPSDLVGYGEASRFMATFDLPLLRFIRDGRWKYIHKVGPELYDVVADPGELENLASVHPEVVDRLRGRLESMLAEAPPPPEDSQAEIDAMTASQLMALGYVAKSPVFEVGNELASFGLHGEDPLTHTPDVQVFSQLGSLMGRGDYARALELIDQLESRNPGKPLVTEQRVRAYLGQERYPEALELLPGLVGADPDNAELRYAHVTALLGASRVDDALLQLRAMRDLNPCDERAMLELDRVLKSEERFAELVETLALGMSGCPELLSTANNYAWALATLPDDSLRDGSEALRVIQGLVDAGADGAPFLDTLAAALAEQGRFEEAVATSERAIEAHREAHGSAEILALLESHRDAFRAGQPVRATTAGS